MGMNAASSELVRRKLIQDSKEISNSSEGGTDLFSGILDLTETVKNKIQTLVMGDELDIASISNSKTDGLISNEQFKKMRLHEAMQEIKKDPDFEKFREIFSLVKAEHDKDKNIPILAKYIELAGLSEEQEEIFGKISFKIRTEIISELHKPSIEPGMNNYTLNVLKELDAFFALGERDFNI